ncbi:hypothetical protein ABB33_17820, partial [Stenotrophomonas acidaminiphila]
SAAIATFVLPGGHSLQIAEAAQKIGVSDRRQPILVKAGHGITRLTRINGDTKDRVAAAPYACCGRRADSAWQRRRGAVARLPARRRATAGSRDAAGASLKRGLRRPIHHQRGRQRQFDRQA